MCLAANTLAVKLTHPVSWESARCRTACPRLITCAEFTDIELIVALDPAIRDAKAVTASFGATKDAAVDRFPAPITRCVIYDLDVGERFLLPVSA